MIRSETMVSVLVFEQLHQPVTVGLPRGQCPGDKQPERCQDELPYSLPWPRAEHDASGLLPHRVGL